MIDEYATGNFPLGFLITIRSYGTWLHGAENGSVDRHGFNVFGTPKMFQSQRLKDFMRREMRGAKPVYLDKDERSCALAAIREVCDFRGYELYAANIRTNHLHAVVGAGETNPDKIINEFKAYATRRLRQTGLVEKDKTVWARGGSRRYLWKPHHVETAIEYVLFGQGGEIPAFE